MGSFLFNILKGFLWVLALLPLRILYVISDLLYYPLYYVVGYRKKVVRRNLKNSFPEKSDREIRRIEQDFYHFFCDYVMETIKLLHISNEEMARRFRFTNPELLHSVLKDGKPVFMMLGHYGNWEWVTSITRISTPDVVFAQIYRPLSNKAADKFFLTLRKRFGSFGIPKNDTLREVLRAKKENRQMVTGFIADQTPSKNNLHYWTQFLHQDTPFLTGGEKIARKIDANVLYLDVTRVKRGYYESEIKVISLDSPQTAEFEITEKYKQLMEQTIRRAPAFWLWTHKRWKHKRENGSVAPQSIN